MSIKSIAYLNQGWEFTILLIAHLLIRSFCSNQMSDCERIAQVAHDKKATVSNSHRSLMINERMSDLLKKIWIKNLKSYFYSMFYIGFFYIKNPLTPANENFADFRETSSACSTWYAEFRTFRIFKISLSVPKICENDTV